MGEWIANACVRWDEMMMVATMANALGMTECQIHDIYVSTTHNVVWRSWISSLRRWSQLGLCVWRRWRRKSVEDACSLHRSDYAEIHSIYIVYARFSLILQLYTQSNATAQRCIASFAMFTSHMRNCVVEYFPCLYKEFILFNFIYIRAA